MPEAVIVEAVRTPVGRKKGGLSGIRADDLAALAQLQFELPKVVNARFRE